MLEGKNIAGALEGKVHIPRKFPQRDGSLTLSIAMIMLTFTFILLLTSVSSSHARDDLEEDWYQENDEQRDKLWDQSYVTGFAGMVLFFVTLPVLFAGALYLMHGRETLHGGSRGRVITGFVFFVIVFFVMLFLEPVYFFYSYSASTISPGFQMIVTLLSVLLFAGLFLELLPQVPVKRRRLILIGFIVVIVPLSLFSLLALISEPGNRFFLAPVPLYIMKALLCTLSAIALFLVFRSLREREGSVEPSSYVTRAASSPGAHIESSGPDVPLNAGEEYRYPISDEGKTVFRIHGAAPESMGDGGGWMPPTGGIPGSFDDPHGTWDGRARNDRNVPSGQEWAGTPAHGRRGALEREWAGTPGQDWRGAPGREDQRRVKSYHLGGEHDNGMQEKRGLKSLFSMKSDGPTRAYRRPRKNGDPNEGYGGDDGKW